MGCNTRRQTTALDAQCVMNGVLWGEVVGDVAEHAIIAREQLVDVCVITDWLAQGTVLKTVTQLITVNSAPPTYQAFSSSSNSKRQVAD